MSGFTPFSFKLSAVTSCEVNVIRIPRLLLFKPACPYLDGAVSIKNTEDRLRRTPVSSIRAEFVAIDVLVIGDDDRLIVWSDDEHSRRRPTIVC